jgi:diguanylate cyclase
LDLLQSLLARLALETDPDKVGAAFAHDRNFVGLSLIVAMMTSFAFFELVARSRVRTGVPALVWRSLSGAVFGFGMWATHFVGLIAFESPLERGLAFAPAAGSALCAIVCGQIALQLMDLHRPGFRSALGVAIMAIGGVGMHYWGLTGLLVDGALSFRAEWAMATVIGTMVSCFIVLVLVQRLVTRTHRLLAAIPSAAAVAGLHYLDMAATVITPMPRFAPPDIFAALPLALAVAAAAGLVSVGAVAAAISDERRFARQRLADGEHVVVIPMSRAGADAIVDLPE